MKKVLLVIPFVIMAACASETTAPSDGIVKAGSVMTAKGDAATCVRYDGVYARGFNEFGYNYCARNFVGTFGGWCAAKGFDWDCSGADPKYGYPAYANDHLVMKWNEEWDRGNAENWTKPPYAAWTDNEWNGMRPDGSRFTEHFKTRWDAGCTNQGISSNGGYCIWEQFEVLMDQGMDPDHLHWWASHASPTGYGAK